MRQSKLVLLSGVILLLVTEALAHSFKDTIVDEYDQTNLHTMTGIGLGKKAIKKDYFIMFYASWCPHCQRFASIWMDFKKQNIKDGIIAVHCPDNHDLCEQFRVQGYPTLLLVTKEKYQYCTFSDQRTIENVQAFWDKKCDNASMFDIPYTVTGADTGEQDNDDEDVDEKDAELKELDGTVTKKVEVDESQLDEIEKKKQKKYFKVQKNKAYEDKIMKVKDYLKKLGPLTIVALISLCILSVTFVCNKCCSYEQEDPFTKKVLKSVEKKSKGGYQQTKNTDKSSYVL